ncbi:hypothetical protein K5V21_06915 [Clostridium sardiniense]|uniref:Uncharacterized protein n=1 Tax=Clostridium sardiniense TaxID=29369 RepID=A0ABS7KWJ0_CLOSR|nr:hypothetical protein [Clostridium sardiniense]MBY0755183.1 hypothetical protein [Clostridium sardiniense]MDQ0461130.1 hypothetical protein [Clostridium sardiniense]
MKNKITKNSIILIFISLIIIILSIMYIIYIMDKPVIQVNSPIIIDSDANIDLTGDGISENIKILESNNHSDIQITTLKETILLSSLISDKHLSDYSNSYNMNVFILNISRDNKPEILIQGYKKDLPIAYLFAYESDKFVLKLSSNDSIVGLIDSNMNRTPQIQFFDKSNPKSSFKNFMLINNNFVDISKNSEIVTDYDKILKFINLVTLDYEVTDYPDIFYKYIDNSILSKIWQLNKDEFTYSFKNSFFYDNKVDNNGLIENIRWNIVFERINKISSKKNEIFFELDFSRENGTSFNISNIEIK